MLWEDRAYIRIQLCQQGKLASFPTDKLGTGALRTGEGQSEAVTV